jgi:hypothetical protein
MSSFADALRALNQIKAEGVVDDYASASCDLNTSSLSIWRPARERENAANVRRPFSSFLI